MSASVIPLASSPREAAGPRGCSHVFEREAGFELVRLVSERGMSASFAPGAGMTCCSLSEAGEELLGARYGLEAFAGCGVTMGLSLLHPWAGRLPSWRYHALGETVRLPVSPRLHTDGSGLPVNGVQARRDDWRIVGVDSDTGRGRLDTTLSFDQDAQLELFPFPHHLHVHAELSGSTLTIVTTLEATGGVPVPVCFGQRAYVRRDPGRRTTIALPSRRWLETDYRGLPTGGSHRLGATVHWVGSAPLDDVFELTAGRRMTVSSGVRGTTLEVGEGFRFARVRARADEADVVVEALTAEPAALGHDAFAVALPERPYRSVLRLSTSALRGGTSRALRRIAA